MAEIGTGLCRCDEQRRILFGGAGDEVLSRFLSIAIYRPMEDQAKQELARAIVDDAVRRYAVRRRERIDEFVDRHFTLAGSLALHRHAIGWDLVRAPANLFLAAPAFAIKLASWAARQTGHQQLAIWLASRRLILQTQVVREIECLVATEFLELPCQSRAGVSSRDAIAQLILVDPRAAESLNAAAAALASIDPERRRQFAASVEAYLGSRSAAAEIATGFVAAGFGALAAKQATPGLVTLSSAIAGVIAQQAAIAAFPLGAGLGGLWYGFFPASAGPGLLAATTAAVFLTGAMLAAFSGIVTDPLQRRLGLHRQRLQRLVDAFEGVLGGSGGQHITLRDHYIARLIDIFDLVALALRVSHA